MEHRNNIIIINFSVQIQVSLLIRLASHTFYIRIINFTLIKVNESLINKQVIYHLHVIRELFLWLHFFKTSQHVYCMGYEWDLS